MRYGVVLLLVAGVAAPAIAQEPKEAEVAVVRRDLETKIQAARVGVEARVTKGAPYSAEAVTESTQVLADGNRIVTKSVARVFRDTEGRTRREQLDPNGTDVRIVTIADPVSGGGYMLDPAKHLAFENGVFITTPDGVGTATVAGSGGGFVALRTPEPGVAVAGSEQADKVVAEVRARAVAGELMPTTAAGVGGRGGVTAVAVSPSLARVTADAMNVSREDLGQQTIDGVVATGTRTITEIPAGKIGNEQPIKIVSEQWFSQDLQVLVMTKHADPRTGETVYRLTNLIRAEQPKSLFEVPADYTLQQSRIRRQQ